MVAGVDDVNLVVWEYDNWCKVVMADDSIRITLDGEVNNSTDELMVGKDNVEISVCDDTNTEGNVVTIDDSKVSVLKDDREWKDKVVVTASDGDVRRDG